MYAICGDCISGREFPAGKDRLHDLIAERYPLDAIEQGGFVHTRRWRCFETKHDFRLDAGFDEILDALNLHMCEFALCLVSHVAPYRRVNAIDLPHFVVRETNLATSDFFAAGLEGRAKQGDDAIGLGESQSVRPRGKGRNLTMTCQSGDDAAGNAFQIGRFGLRGHT